MLGKNGSGKSTLMKIFSGAYRASGGEVFLDGKKLELHSTEDDMKEGTVTVYQELSVIKDLTVGENLMVGKLPVKRPGRIDWPLVYRKAKEILDYLQIDLDTRAYVRDLTVGQQQLVEIAKAMLAEPKVLILDEPASALSDKDCENLFRVVSDLKRRGIMILFISHRLQEIFKIADKVMVLRDGLLAGTEEAANLDAASLVQMMFGNVSHSVKEKSYVQEETILAVEHFSNHKLKDVGTDSAKRGDSGAGRNAGLRSDRTSAGNLRTGQGTGGKTVPSRKGNKEVESRRHEAAWVWIYLGKPEGGGLVPAVKCGGQPCAGKLKRDQPGKTALRSAPYA